MQAGSSIVAKQQPPVTGKVILVTTNGQIQIELWTRQMPLACQNFLKHCANGYYNDTIFHRMIPAFMIQGGDPTGTGTGGQSIYGQPFKNQYHQRIKFGRRGMVAMANSGKDTNKSQFFITFGQCPHLNKDYTIFGKVVGDSIYTLLSFQSLDTDSSDRPTDPPYLRKVKVLLNPFEQSIPHNKQNMINQLQIDQENRIAAQLQVARKKIKKTEIKKLKNKKKLTFDDFQEDQDTNKQTYKMASSHDALNDHKLSKQVAITQETLSRKRQQKQQQNIKKKEIIQRMNQVVNNPDQLTNPDNLNQMLQAELQRKKKLAQNSQNNENTQNVVTDEVLNYHKHFNKSTGKMQIYWGDKPPLQEVQQQQSQEEEQKMNKLRELQQREYQALKADELNFKRLKQGSEKVHRKQLVAQQKQLLSNAEKRKYQFLKQKSTGKKQGQILNKLEQFKGRLSNENKNDWMCHQLKFHIDSENAYSLDKKNKERKNREQDQDDGGLKIQYS